jgi:tetratricopeptide (TPR) repeat protein
LAYAKAIGNVDLESALQEINEALNSDKNAAYLDTRGFIYYRMGKYDLALNDLDPAVKEVEGDLHLLHAHADLERRAAPDIRVYEIQFRKDNEPVAVMRYHRALVHEKLGHSAAAAADRKRVRELIGRDGDEKLF